MKHHLHPRRRPSNSRRSRPLTWVATIGTVGCLTSAAAAQGDMRYRVVPVPMPDGVRFASALGMNNSNQVTGSVSFDGQVRPFIASDGVCTMLDQVPGIYTTANAISDKGHIAGWMYEWGVIWPQAFLWDGETNHWLIDPHDSYTYAQGLNNRDQVVGFYYPPGGNANGDAFVVSQGRYYNLGGGQATDINDDGVIVGYSSGAAVWTPDVRGNWSVTTLDGKLATAINEAGTMVVGAGPLFSYFDTAALWTRKGNTWVRTDIGGWDPNVTNAISNDVNNAGQVVGRYESFTDIDRGWIFENGEVTWLTDLLTAESAEWDVIAASRVNESGVILADAQRKGEPFPVPVLLIPETLTMLAPRGDGPGATNELIAVSAVPGARIYFIYGFIGGKHSVPGCPGVSIGLASPRLAGSATADAEREARVAVFIPSAASGRSVYLQAVDPANCAVSNVLLYTFR